MLVTLSGTEANVFTLISGLLSESDTELAVAVVGILTGRDLTSSITISPSSSLVISWVRSTSTGNFFCDFFLLDILTT